MHSKSINGAAGKFFLLCVMLWWQWQQKSRLIIISTGVFLECISHHFSWGGGGIFEFVIMYDYLKKLFSNEHVGCKVLREARTIFNTFFLLQLLFTTKVIYL